MASSNSALLLNVAACGIYGYSAYYMNYNPNLRKMHNLIPPELRIYGQLKFLTYQCLVIQLLSSVLHVLAHFIRPLRKARDIVFTCLAYPVGSIVVYSFWAVWFLMGRELIFPKELSQFYPDWLNHATHSIIAPINILLAIMVHHKYPRHGGFLTLLYTLLYTIFLHVIKYQSGLFVYKYLDVMSDSQRLVYFIFTGMFCFAMYKSGQLLTQLSHGGPNAGASGGKGFSSKTTTTTTTTSSKQQQANKKSKQK